MHLVVLVFVAFLVVGDAFLFLFAKHEPVFCYKICPLYCSSRRHDKGASSDKYNPAEIYAKFAEYKRRVDRSTYDFDLSSIGDELPYYPPISKYHQEDHEETYWYPHEYHPRILLCKPETTTTTTTTTKPPPTTTPEPTYICLQCKNKCNYP